MIPWVHLDTSVIPGSPGELKLMRRGAEFSIMLGGNELMNSRLSGSERVLAELGCRPVAGRPGARVLVGGLGMGFTLRAAQGELGADARITVAELVPAVVAWARGPMAEVFGDSLADPRLSIREEDVGKVIGEAESAFDAILLDVDNGPDGLTSPANGALYAAAGLSRARRALRPGGVLAVWSAHPSPSFTARLRQAGFSAEAVPVRAHGKRGGARHTVWVATARSCPAR